MGYFCGQIRIRLFVVAEALPWRVSIECGRNCRMDTIDNSSYSIVDDVCVWDGILLSVCGFGVCNIGGNLAARFIWIGIYSWVCISAINGDDYVWYSAPSSLGGHFNWLYENVVTAF